MCQRIMCCLLFMSTIVQAQSRPGMPAPAAQQKIAQGYGKLPLSFEANAGQTDPQVKFLSRGAGYTVFLTGDEAVFALSSGKPDDSAKVKNIGRQPRTARKTVTTDAVLRMKLRNANPGASVAGADELPGKSNYFIGNDPKNWRTNVPQYEKVKYAGIYPGIDLVYYGNQRQLEYDFVVAPGADPSRIQFDVRGAKRIHRDKDGDLVLAMASRQIRWRKPRIYQEHDGTRHEIEGRYLIKHGRRVSFEVAHYDSRRPLIIDPALAYSSYLGGSNVDEVSRPALDAAGNAYVTGYTRSTDFPVTPGVFQSMCGAGSNCDNEGTAFVTKINSTGSALVYSTYLGGSGGDQGNSIALDSAGDAYVVGTTSSNDFPTTPGAFQTACTGGCSNGDDDAFVTELSPSGSALVYSTYLGGSVFEEGSGIAVGASGDAYVVGETWSENFPVTPGAFQTTCKGGCTSSDIFVTRFNSTGSALVYSTYLGGSYYDYGVGIALDAAGDAFVTGSTTSTDFPVTVGAFQPATGGGGYDAFVTELNPVGSALIYSTYLGGNQTDYGSAIALDAAGDAYVTGLTVSTDFPITSGAFQTTCHGCTNGWNGYVTELNSAGSALVYSTYLGGSTYDSGSGITVDAGGDAYVAGATLSTDFPVTAGAFQTTCGGGCANNAEDGFVTELNPSGSALLYSTYLGGSNGDEAAGVAVDGAGDIYVTGVTGSTDFPITPGSFQTTCAGGCSYADGFVTKFGPGDQVWPLVLAFGNQPVGVSSTQVAVLSNSGNTSLSITSIKLIGANSGDFSETDNCGTSLPAGATCNIAITFLPTTTGIRNAAVTITDGAQNSPQSVALSGTGIITVTLLPTSLNFSPQLLGTTSQPMSAMLSTNGTLSIASIATSGPFSQINNCGTGLPPGGNCTINVTFTPTGLGPQSGTLTVSDNSPGSPQTISLSGTGGQATVTLSPTNLNFGNQTLGVASNAMTSMLMNTGNVALTIDSINLTGVNSGDFAETNNCGISVAAGGTCTITVTFTPGAIGTRSAAVNITDNAPNSPQSLPLAGVGIPPVVSLSPSSVSFGSQTVGTSSAPQIVQLSTNGTLSITSIVSTAEFTQTNNCGSGLAAGGSCEINVAFAPSATGFQSGTLTITDSGVGSPQTVTLSGTGVLPGVGLSPPAIGFPAQYVGTSGLPQTLTVTNTGTAPLTITNVTTSPADFGTLSNCTNSVAPNMNCTIGVFFDPTVSGARTGTLTLTDNVSNSPQTVPLSGTGQDFAMASSGSSTASVSPGQTASYTLAVAPAGGFKQTVSLTCSGSPAGSTCSVPGSVTLNGSTPTMVTVTVTTAATPGSLVSPAGFSPKSGRLALWLTLVGLPGLVLLRNLGAGRYRRGRFYGFSLLCLFFLAFSWSGCGGSSNSGGGAGTPGTYNLIVTGTFTSGSTTLTHDTKLTLVVQ